MATQTAHFELEKPALTDVADIAVLNNNFDDIDVVMFANQERSVAAVSNQADAYDAAQTYAGGDLVIYENRLYKCTTAVTVAEPWDSTKWTQTTLAESGGTGVEANPTGEPTDTLETIGIDGTIYEVGGSEPVSKTVTGNPISITDAADGPIVSGVVTFEPMQEGTGTPSPENIRPITGYTDCELEVTGKNLLQNTATTNTVNGITYTVNSDGSVVASGTANGTAVLQICSKIPIDVSWGTVTLSGLENATNLIWNSVTLYDDSDTVVEHIVTTGSGQNKYNKTFNLADYPTVTKISVSIKRGGASDGVVSGTIYPQLEKGSTATSYEPYQSTTSTIDLDGTRYGGTVDLVSGVMVVDRAMVDMGSLTYTYVTAYNRFMCSISGIKQGLVRTLPLICSCYQSIDDGRPLSQVPDSSIYNDQNNENIYIHDSRYTSASALKTALTGQTLCYPLATPFTVQLTPEQIRTLQGTNNISTNMTSMTLEYITQDYQKLVKLIERSAGHHYSTQERVVGTWIDGKPIYEKTFDVGYLLNNSIKHISHGILNIKNIISIIGGGKTDGGIMFPIIYSHPDNVSSGVAVTVDSTNIDLTTKTDRTTWYVYLTIQYTKTTD